tara:strand:- start:427 stop:723 length:297 start_codon:yes stop_codon:yes gene_type:complete
MKFYLNIPTKKCTTFLILFISLISTNSTLLNAQESYLKDIQIDSSTKPEENSLDLPTNPFQLVEMIRRANSMNDATKPSDAIDDALKSFDKIEEREKL